MDLYAVRQKLNMGIPLSSINLRATDYSRVSTDHEEQKSSLKNQIEHFDEMIKNNENWIYVQGYVDDGISGTTDYKRDNFMKMIEDAREGKFDLIITKEISRFSRNTLDSIKYTRELLSYGVAVLFVNDNINTALPDAELRLTIMASMAQDEIRRLSERVKFGMKRSIKNGNILGNDLLYGYKKNKETGNLVIISEEAVNVKRLFNMYAIDNMAFSKIAKIFNEEGILTSQKRKWCASTLTRMVRNPKYKGYYCARKTEIVDYISKKVKKFDKDEWVLYEDKERIPPIIDEELWDKANRRLESRSFKFGKDFGKDKVMYQHRYPLSAKIYCGEHNEVFHRRMQLKSSDDVTWLCSRYLKEGKKVCDSPNIRESEINAIFSEIMKGLEIDLSNVSKMLLELYQNSKSEIDFDNKMADYQKIKDKIGKKKDKLLELSIEGNISNSEFYQKNNELNNELKKVEDDIIILERNKESFNQIKEKNNELEKILNIKIKSNATNNKLIDLLLDKIIVSKINNDNTNLELKVFLNFSKDGKEQNGELNIKNFKNFMTKSMEFKRGYNTNSTIRYTIKYLVIVYVCV